MSKLLEMERAIGIADAIQLRNLVMEAEAALLEMQRNELTALDTASRTAAPAPRSEPHIPGWREAASSIHRRAPVGEVPENPMKLTIGSPRRLLA